MALTAIGSSIIGFIFMAVITGKSQKHFNKQQEGLGTTNGHIEEIYSNHNVVQVYNGGKEAKQVFEGLNEDLYISGWKSEFMSGMMFPLMVFIGNFSFVAVCIVGATLFMQGTIQFGVIIAFTIYVGLFSQPLTDLAQAFLHIQKITAASKRIFDFFDEEEMENESHKTSLFKDVKGEIEFRNVKFGYDPTKTVIHDFSAKINAGQKIAIVGPTGAGKTTIVNLLMRFYELDGGEILLDGIPINKVARENVQEQFSMVLQDTWLFEGTIKENIVYCKQNVLEDEIANACKVVGLDHFINTLPQGYDTILNDKINLSQGQKQLLTIARALVQDAPILILDEATSSVDTRTEYLIQKSMDQLMVGRTSFIIAHRLSTIKNADLILVMKDGDIVESGTHQTLLQKSGFYTELYNSQFELTA